MDGSNKQQIGYSDTWQFSVTKDAVYYVRYGELHKVSSDGTDQTYDAGGDVRNINAAGGWVYYIRGNYNSQIYKVKADGTQKEQVTYFPVSCLNISGDYMYFGNYNDGGSIYRMKLDGTDMKKLTNDCVNNFINITGDWVYYNVYDGSTGEEINYKVKLDGSERQRFVPIVSIDPITARVQQGQYYYFPSYVKAVLADGRTQQVYVKWDNSSLDTSIPGTYTFEGTVEGYTEKVILTVNVQVIEADEIVTFASSALESVIRGQIGNYDRPILKSEVEKITSLHA
jgi:hypothetical protein